MSRSPRRTPNRFRPAVESLDDRIVPAAIAELALGAGVPAPLGIVAGPGGNWYTDPGANKVGRIATDGSVTEYSLATPLSDPRGIAVGSDGALWIALFGVDAIGRLDPTTGAITQFALTAGSGPTEIVSGPDGRLWFTAIGSDQIGAITTAGVSSVVATLGVGDLPFGITNGPDGRLWFTEFGSNEIGAVTTDGSVSEFSVATALAPGAGITTGPDGNLWFGSSSAAVIGRITTAGVLTEFTGFGTAATTIGDIVSGPDGALWFTHGTGDAIGRITTAGTVTDEFATTSLGAPTGIEAGADGNLYFTEPGTASVTQITTAGAQTTTQLVASSGPTELTATSDGTVWYTQADANKIGRIVQTTNAIIEYSLPTALSDPRGITAGPDGNVWFTEFGGDRIGRITSAGVLTEFSTGLTVGAGPRDIAVGSDGALWFTEAAADQIGRIDTTGAITEFAVPGAGSVPFEIVGGSDGRLWFTQNGSDEIGAITTGGSISEFSTLTPDAGPTGIASAIDGRLWFTEATANQLGQISIAGVVAETSTGLTAAAGLAGIATLPTGSLVVAETTANQVANVFVGSPFGGATTIAAGTDRGTLNRAIVYNAAGSELYNLIPFDPNFQGGVRVALADVNGDAIADLIAATGPGVPTRVVVFDGDTQQMIFDVMPFEASFAGGVYVSAADLTGDGIAEIVVSPDEGGGPRVDIYAGGTTFPRIGTFFGIADPNFRGGARTAIGDVDGDGRADLAVAAGFGGGPRVAVFDGTTITNADPTRLFNDFFVFEQTLRNGAFIALGDLDGDGMAELIAGGGPGGGPRVTAFNGANLVSSGGATQTPVANFFAGDPNLRGGIRVSTKNIDGDALADLVVGAGTGGGSTITEFLGVLVAANPGAPPPELAFDGIPGFTGGVYVG